MEILLDSTHNDIYTLNLNVTAKTLCLSGCNNFPLDASSLKEIYDVTAGGPIGLPAFNNFAWFRANGLPVFIWIVSSLPAGAANGDSLNVMLCIPQNQSLLSLWQKYAGASAGTPGTYTEETPTGTINGTNQTFTLANTPINGAITLVYTASGQPTVFLYYNIDFTVVGNVITTVAPPLTGSTLYSISYH